MDTRSDNHEFDAIVVGSGPGGATVARELSRTKKKVLVLERGAQPPLKEGFRTTLSILNAVRVGDNLAAARAFTTGGTTAIYFAVADLPPLETFRSLGIDLTRELEEAKRELPLTVLPDDLVGAQALRVRDSATQLGYDWKKNTMLIDLSRCASGYAYGARWNARSYLQEAVKEGATLATRATVRRVLVENGRAIGVEYALRKTRKTVVVRRAFGTKIVLAAGGAASPVILRDSGMRNVARDGFYCHPSFAVFGLVPGLKAGENFVASMGTDLEEGLGVGDGNPARRMHRLVMLGNHRFFRAFRHSRSIGVGVMLKEDLGGGLRDDGRYYKELKKEDRGKLERGEQIARRIVERAGGRHLFTSPLASAHVGGTIRINEHLDEHLQTEYRNLHVCDGSVIPGNVRVSPALTLVCLGKYLASRVATAL